MAEAWVVGGVTLGAYLLGSVPFGVLASRWFHTQDPRTAGSGNIGFSNVIRVSGKISGALTLIGDLGKGFLAVWLAQPWVGAFPWQLLVAAAVILGHIFSIFLRFHGGKGVATALGAIAALDWIVATFVAMVWAITAVLWRYSSSAAIAASLAFPCIVMIGGRSWSFVGFAVFVSVLVIARHRDNIERLLEGTEGRMGDS